MQTSNLSTLTSQSASAQSAGSPGFLEARAMMPPPSAINKAGEYVLATGEAAAHRLRILHSLYGPGTRQLLQRAGLKRGMRAADIGCGVGTVTQVLAEFVGNNGYAVGVDISDAQAAQARKHLADNNLTNTRLLTASATNTEMPSGSFDLVYCRFLLLHLPNPTAALCEMYRLLKPNGILVCEDGDLTSAGSEPCSALDMFAALFGRLGLSRGVDYTLGRQLHQMVQATGFSAPEITYNQPVIARGENKRLLELSVAEARSAFVQAGLITDAVLDRTLREMQRLAQDESVLAVMPRMSQVWAQKPELSRHSDVKTS